MPNPRSRVVGGQYTTFQYKGQTIAFLDAVEDSGQRAFSDLGQPYQFIQPLGEIHPVEIATSRVLQGGTLQVTIRELWSGYVWQQLAGLAGANTIVDIFNFLANDPQSVTCQMIVKPPNGSGPYRGKIYQNCTIVDINDGDSVTLGGMTVTKGLTIAYTHFVAYSNGNASR